MVLGSVSRRCRSVILWHLDLTETEAARLPWVGGKCDANWLVAGAFLTENPSNSAGEAVRSQPRPQPLPNPTSILCFGPTRPVPRKDKYEVMVSCARGRAGRAEWTIARRLARLCWRGMALGIDYPLVHFLRAPDAGWGLWEINAGEWKSTNLQTGWEWWYPPAETGSGPSTY